MTTYTNLGIKEISTGDEAGTWGTSTNTNFEYFDTAIVGYVDIALFTAGSVGSPNTLNVANFAVSDGRNRVVSFSSAGDLGGTAYVQITPNTFHGYYFIKNDLAANRNVTIFQGTWNGTDPNRAITITNGKEAIIRCDGAGVAAVVTRVLANFQTDSVDATSMTAGSVTVSGAFNGPGTGLTGTASGLSIGGSAGTSTITTDDTTNATVYPTWSTTLSGSTSLKASTDLNYNPFTGTLSASSLSGIFIGEADGETYSTDDAVVAGTDAQGQAPLTADYSVIITTAANPSGITLPAATQGRRMIVVNRGTNPINIYPDTGDAIDSSSINIPINLPVNGWMEFNASSTSQWYSTANIVVTASTGVSSFAAGTTGLTPAGATTGAVTLGGTLALANGGTGQTTKSAAFNALSPITSTGDLIIGNGTNSATRLGIGTNGQVLTSNGTTASWQTSTGGVTSFNAGSTGFTPSIATTGAITLGGTLAITNGGTGQTTKSAAFNALSPVTSTGDLILGNGVNSATRLAIGTANQILTSNGTTASWSSGISVTTLSASSTVSGTGFTNYLASPPAIGGTTAAAGSFTTLAASSTVSGTGFTNYLASPPAIGGTTASTVRGTTITATTGFSGPLNGTVGASTPSTGAFTTLSSSSVISFGAATGNGTNLIKSDETVHTLGIATSPSATGGTRVRIVGMGTSSSSVALKILDNAATPVTMFDFTDDGSLQTASSTSGKTGAPYNNTTASAANVVVNTSGVFQRSTSSIKYKRDVENFAPGLSATLQLRPVTYKGKNPNDGEEVFGGLIAEEVAAIPGLDPFVVKAVDGSPDGLAYGNMVALLVNAIKEQNAVIEDLKLRVAALEAR